MTTTTDPLRDLALSYAPRDRRTGLGALFALDAALAQVLRTTREPMVGQIRLAWWREALARLDEAPPPGEPVLQALAMDVVPRGVGGVALAGLVDGWEPLLGSLDEAAIDAHARLRGAALFIHAGQVLGTAGSDPLDLAGRGWALADLAAHLSDAGRAAEAKAVALPLLEAATRVRWSRPGRPLGALALIACTERAAPARVLRLAWHRATGR